MWSADYKILLHLFWGNRQAEGEVFYISSQKYHEGVFLYKFKDKYYGGWKQGFLEHQKYSSVYDNSLEPRIYINWQGDFPLPSSATEQPIALK